MKKGALNNATKPAIGLQGAVLTLCLLDDPSINRRGRRRSRHSISSRLAGVCRPRMGTAERSATHRDADRIGCASNLCFRGVRMQVEKLLERSIKKGSLTLV